MKKVIFFILSTVFVLIIPNVVNAEVANWTVPNRSPVFSGQTVDVEIWAPFSTQQGYLVFSAFAQDNRSVPYSAQLIGDSGGSIGTCNVGSVAVNEAVDTVGYVLNFNCPVTLNSDRIRYIRMYRNTETSPANGLLTMPPQVSFYPNDLTSITTNTNNTTNAVNNLNDSINNDTVSTNTENSSTAQSWASQSASDSVVSDMVLMPITLLNAFSSGFSGSCQAYNLGSLYGTNLTLPCINISNYLGATLWGIIDVLMSGFLIYGIGKKFVRVFNDFTNLKDSQVDELYGGGNE